MRKLNVNADDLSHLYWVLFLNYFVFGFFGIWWFADYYFNEAGKSKVLMFFLSVSVLLLGALGNILPTIGRGWGFVCVLVLNIIFFAFMVFVFGFSGFLGMNFLLLVILVAKFIAR